jgi:hypothetical protein
MSEKNDNHQLLAGKGVRQVTRLLRLLYRRRHFFFIHVDETSHWMYSQLEYLNSRPNIRCGILQDYDIFTLKMVKQVKKCRNSNG